MICSDARTSVTNETSGWDDASISLPRDTNERDAGSSYERPSVRGATLAWIGSTMTRVVVRSIHTSWFSGLVLLTASCHVREASWNQDRRLWEMARIGDVKSVKAELEAGADPNATLDFDGRDWGATPLTRAALSGHTDVVVVLVAAGAEMSVEDADGYTPLSAAAGGGHADTVRKLLELGFDANFKTRRGESALFNAASRDVVRVLVEAGADVDTKNTSSVSALFGPSSAGEYDLVDELLNSGADPNITAGNGETALRYASGNGHSRVVRRLIEAGADVNAKTLDGETALMAPLDNGFRGMMEENIPRHQIPEVMRLLIDAGADVNARAGNGVSVMEMARRGRNYASDRIAKLLIEAGGS